MQILLQDLKHAFKLFRESPGFTLTVIAALTIGIGSNTAIFSVVNAVVLKPIPFDEPDGMVRVLNKNRETGGVGAAASPAKFMPWRAQTDVLADVAAMRSNSLNYTAGDLPEQISANQVSEAFFRVFRAPIVEGRGFAPEDDLPGAPLTVVLTYDFWKQRLAGDPGVVGRTLSLSGDTYTVIGITGEDLDLRDFGDPDVFVPFRFDLNTTDQGHYFTAVARLAPGVTPEQADERLDASADVYRERYPDALGPNAGFAIRTLQETMVGAGARRTLWILLGAVGFVFGGSALLLAAIGIYGLMAYYSVQQGFQEIGIRKAMGADRRVVRNMVVKQGMALVMVGMVVGLVAAFFLANVIASFLFEVEPRDPVVFAGVTSVLIAIGLAAVAVPALRAAAVDPLEAARYD
jgi:putative ABC transport system permease protein